MSRCHVIIVLSHCHDIMLWCHVAMICCDAVMSGCLHVVAVIVLCHDTSWCYAVPDHVRSGSMEGLYISIWDVSDVWRIWPNYPRRIPWYGHKLGTIGQDHQKQTTTWYYMTWQHYMTHYNNMILHDMTWQHYMTHYNNMILNDMK